MTYTEKRLEEFDEIMLNLQVNDYRVVYQDLITDEKSLTYRGAVIRQFLAESIQQALAEDRVSVRGEIEGEMEKLRKPLLKNDPKYFIDGKEMRLMGESDSSKYWKDYASERYNQALDDLKPIISNLLK